MEPTPSQTVGPFFGYALPFPGGEELAPHGDPNLITVRGVVYDGEGVPVPDALVEIWQADGEGSLTGRPGTLRRDPVTGAVIGRNGVDFTGFARSATDASGHWFVRTVAPAPHRDGAVPYLAVCVFARGLLHHLFTRVHLPEHADALAADAVFGQLSPERRATLVAVEERPGVHRFDIRLQEGPAGEETVFLDFA